MPTLEPLATEPPSTQPPTPSPALEATPTDTPLPSPPPAPPTDTALPPGTETATLPIGSPNPAQVPTEVPTQTTPSDTPVPSYPSTPLPGQIPSTMEPAPTLPGTGTGGGDSATTPTGEPAPYSATLTDTPVASQTSTATGTATATVTSTPTMTPTATPDWLPPGPECKPVPGEVIVQLPVPYVHQVLDIGGADGNWACGPTSLVMVLAYYGKLDMWSDYMAQQSTGTTTATVTRIAGNATHVTPARVAGTTDATPATVPGGGDFAPYVTNEYSNSGYTYDALARDPQGNPVAGLYGAICPTGFADWTRMATVLRQHGLQSRYIGANWDAVVGALNRGHPVVLGNDLTASGHVLVATGYTKNGHLLVNDPYGNRFAPGYGSTNGQALLYPWDCARVRTALEVIGEYPPPPRASATSTQTATMTSVPTTPQPPNADPGSHVEQVPRRDTAAPKQPTAQSVHQKDMGSDSFGGTENGTTSTGQSRNLAKTVLPVGQVTIPASGKTGLGENSQTTGQGTNAVHGAVDNAGAQGGTWSLGFEWALLSTLCAVLALVRAASWRRLWFPTAIYITTPDAPALVEPVHDPEEVPGTGRNP